MRFLKLVNGAMHYPFIMKTISQVYVDGAFVTPHGTEMFNLFNPATGRVIGQVRLGDGEDARRAVAAAKKAFPAFSRTSKAQRIEMLRRLQAAVEARVDALCAAIVEEFGKPVRTVRSSVQYAA